MRPTSTRRMIAPLLLTPLLAIVAIACAVSSPFGQGGADQTKVAEIQASLNELNDQRTGTAAAAISRGTATAIAATARAEQARQNRHETSTAQAVASTGTAEGALNEANAPAGWKLKLYEPFEDNSNKWPTGKGDDNELNHMDIQITQNEYLWTARSRQGFVQWGIPYDLDSASDFYITVDGKLESGEQSAYYGLIARVSGAGNYYLFMVNEQKSWEIAVHNEDVWNTLRYGQSTLISEGGNHLAVLGVGKDFTFYVNGVELARVSDERVEQGTMGVIFSMGFRGAESKVSYDNFMLLTP